MTIQTFQTSSKEYLLPLLREARKVRIRLIVLPQDDAVESLQIQGQGAARANLTYIRLGKTAIAHANKLDPAIAIAVGSMARPCLVEDAPAMVPSFGGLPGSTAPAITTGPQTAPVDPIAQLERAWQMDAIEVGHETIAREPAAPTVEQIELIEAIVAIARRHDRPITASDCIRGSRPLKAIGADAIRSLFVIAQAMGRGTYADGKFTALG